MSLADGACGVRFFHVEILVLHVLESQFHLEFFDIDLVKVFGDTFNVFIQLLQLSFHFHQRDHLFAIFFLFRVHNDVSPMGEINSDSLIY